jgi:hypothetical protein
MEWTHAERLDAIAQISAALMRDYTNTDKRKVWLGLESIRFLATMTASFLNVNQDNLIDAGYTPGSHASQ